MQFFETMYFVVMWINTILVLTAIGLDTLHIYMLKVNGNPYDIKLKDSIKSAFKSVITLTLLWAVWFL